jgi:glycerol-3-phosphate cytidylyltransferase
MKRKNNNSFKKRKKVLLDMSCSIIHHGHIRLIKKAAKYGDLVISLTSDKDLKKFKNIHPELSFSQRKEILSSIKYVKKVISGKFILDQKFLNKNNIDIVIQGSDYKDRKFTNKVVTFARTKNISSTLIRRLAKKNINKNK